MAVTAFWYGLGLANAFGGTASGGTVMDWEANTIKVSLHLNYSPNQDTHSLWSDVSGSEIAATGGYTAGGSALQNKTLTYTAAGNILAFDGDDQTYSGSTISATQAVIYNASIAGSVLMGYVDFGGTVSSTGGDWTIAWAAGSILAITAS